MATGLIYQTYAPGILALWLSYRSAIAWPSIMQDSRQRKSASQAMGLISDHIQSMCPNTALPTGCALDTQQPATHPPTGQYLGCVWVLALTKTPLGFKRPHWHEAGLRPASSENLAAMFLQIQLDIHTYISTSKNL